jgi:queuine tRNA-ribosyltransferase
VKEILALQLASMHNLTYYLRLVKDARASICAGTFSAWKTETLREMKSVPLTAEV